MAKFDLRKVKRTAYTPPYPAIAPEPPHPVYVLRTVTTYPVAVGEYHYVLRTVKPSTETAEYLGTTHFASIGEGQEYGPYATFAPALGTTVAVHATPVPVPGGVWTRDPFNGMYYWSNGTLDKIYTAILARYTTLYYSPETRKYYNEPHPSDYFYVGMSAGVPGRPAIPAQMYDVTKKRYTDTASSKLDLSGHHATLSIAAGKRGDLGVIPKTGSGTSLIVRREGGFLTYRGASTAVFTDTGGALTMDVKVVASYVYAHLKLAGSYVPGSSVRFKTLVPMKLMGAPYGSEDSIAPSAETLSAPPPVAGEVAFIGSAGLALRQNFAFGGHAHIEGPAEDTLRGTFSFAGTATLSSYPLMSGSGEVAFDGAVSVHIATTGRNKLFLGAVGGSTHNIHGQNTFGGLLLTQTGTVGEVVHITYGTNVLSLGALGSTLVGGLSAGSNALKFSAGGADVSAHQGRNVLRLSNHGSVLYNDPYDRRLLISTVLSIQDNTALVQEPAKAMPVITGHVSVSDSISIVRLYAVPLISGGVQVSSRTYLVPELRLLITGGVAVQSSTWLGTRDVLLASRYDTGITSRLSYGHVKVVITLHNVTYLVNQDGLLMLDGPRGKSKMRLAEVVGDSLRIDGARVLMTGDDATMTVKANQTPKGQYTYPIPVQLADTERNLKVVVGKGLRGSKISIEVAAEDMELSAASVYIDEVKRY